MKTKNKYIVYVDNEYINGIMHSGTPTLDYITKEAQYKHIKQTIIDNVEKILSNDDSQSVFIFPIFIGSDGKRHRSIEIKAVPGFGRHPGRVLRKIKKLRK